MGPLLLCLVAAAGGEDDLVWSSWSVVGPFDYSFDAKAENPLPFALEGFVLDGPGPDLARDGWSELALEALRGGATDVGEIVFPEAHPTVAGATDARVFLHRALRADAARELSLVLGSDDGVRVWWNGALVLEQQVLRTLSLGDGQLELPLAPGTNHLLVELSQKGGGWKFRLARPVAADQAAIDAAIVAGVDYLLERQLIDGSWGAWAGYRGGHTAYVAYVLLKMGLPPRHPAVQRALAYARAWPGEFTYTAACHALALAAGGGDERLLGELVESLVDWQESSGQWGYPLHPDGNPRATPDLSNTLYAALALDAAIARGVKVPVRTWKEMVDGTLRNLGREVDVTLGDGTVPARGFYYWPGNAVTGSMTTAGLSILALAERHAGGKLGRGDRADIERTREDGLRWLAANLDFSRNPGEAGHHYFFLYGVERTASLLDLDEIGGVDWYGEGARYLVNAQKTDGSWGSDPQVDTLLALLFLKRATAPRSGRSALLARAGRPPELEARWLRYPSDAAARRWPAKDLVVEASTTRAGTPAQAVDGRHDTAWQPRADDADAWVRVSVRRPLRGGRLLLTQALPRLLEAEARRVTRVAVQLDDDEERVVELDPACRHKTEVDLGKERFRRLTVRVLATGGDAAKGDAVGFSELELVDR